MLRREAIARMLTGCATGWGIGSSVGQVLGRLVYGKPVSTTTCPTMPTTATQCTPLEPVMVIKQKAGSSDVEIGWIPAGPPVDVSRDREILMNEGPIPL